MTFRKSLRIAYVMLQVVVVSTACWWLSPLDTRTVFTAASEYIQNTGFGPYERLVFSNVQRRPFETCAPADQLHKDLLARVSNALPEIEASSPYEPVRLFRLIRMFNRETQTFYTTRCAGDWTYFYTYVDYQSFLLKVVPVIWVVEVLHRSEIYIVAAMIIGSWFGIVSLFWMSKKLTGSALVGFASLGVLWYTMKFFGPGVYADFRLNLFNTFGLLGAAIFLCELPPISHRLRRWAIELTAAIAFATCSMLLLFPRLSPTKLDTTVVVACLFVVALLRWNRDMLRRAVLVAAVLYAVQYPYTTFSANLLKPVSAVNTGNSEEFKTVSAVQFLTERPSHFGNFILDFNFTWIFDADFYLRQLTPVQSLHHGFPAWGRKFLTETVLHHPTELPNSWWRRFVIQVVYHDPLSFGLYRDYQTGGTRVFWLAVALAAFILVRGRRLASTWPLLSLLFWEVFGLHTLLGLMHVHNLYVLKGIALMWCALPALGFVAVREGWALRTKRPQWSRPSWLHGQRLRVAVVAVSAAALLVGYWAIREYRKEVHVLTVWRAIHVGQYYREDYLSPEDLVKEIDAIRDLGGDGPGTVSMYGAWALFGYVERLGGYNQFASPPITREHVEGMALALFRRALAEGPDNPHFYPYAQYFLPPDRMQIFRTALDRFPDHPYAVMMSWVVGTQDPTLSDVERARIFRLYEARVRRKLGESESYRPGLKETPVLSAPGPIDSTPDGQYTTLLPGEVATLEPFHTYGTDRLAMGLFLKVNEGELSVQLQGQPGAKLAESAPLRPSDPVSYRAWHFTNLEAEAVSGRTAMSALQLKAGPQGARFTVRDLYPLVDNPRWHR